jgi:hypothetical protein
VKALGALLILAGGGFVMVLKWRYGMTRGTNLHVIGLAVLGFAVLCLGGLLYTLA